MLYSISLSSNKPWWVSLASIPIFLEFRYDLQENGELDYRGDSSLFMSRVQMYQSIRKWLCKCTWRNFQRVLSLSAWKNTKAFEISDNWCIKRRGKKMRQISISPRNFPSRYKEWEIKRGRTERKIKKCLKIGTGVNQRRSSIRGINIWQGKSSRSSHHGSDERK